MQLLKALAAATLLVSSASSMPVSVDRLARHAMLHRSRSAAPVQVQVNESNIAYGHDDFSLVKRATGSFWIGNVEHQGIAAYNPSASSYKVFRNVQDYGAKGDGSTDDTAAINSAIADGNRCVKGCDSSTTTPALVYFPPGTYLVSTPIVAIYYTQLVGDAVNPPTLKAASNFAGMAVIDADPYDNTGTNWYTNQNNFFRAVRNFVIDLTATSSGTGIHWQVAQASSLINIVFNMGNTNSQGIFMDNGSGGFMSDLTFNGGKVGAFLGNQQFTTRNFVFNGCQTAVYMNWDWAWTLKSLTINNCGIGIDMSAGQNGAQNVGSVVVLDSTITGTPIGIKTAYNTASDNPKTGGTLVIDNLKTNNVQNIVVSASGATVLAGSGGAITTRSWGQGRKYVNSVGTQQQGPISNTPNKPSSLLDGNGNIYERSRPSYANLAAGNFKSARSAGAKGDGVTDDTTALQNLINSVAGTDNVAFIDHGVYIVTSTITIPAGVKMTGEAWSVIMSSGSFFSSESNPKPVIKVGSAGQTGGVELSDLIFQTQGPAGGAIVVEWNLSGAQGANGMWDVHVRVGGSAGTKLQSDTCTKNPTGDGTQVNPACIGAFMLMHITSGASVYMENNWLWTADHELDLTDHNQISIFSGRGLWVESTSPVWLYGTAVEHNVLYQYQLTSASNVFMGLIQTETPYYQSNPTAMMPFTANPAYKDPVYQCADTLKTSTCAKAWGLRVVGSSNVLIYGAGLYSFFQNYDQNGMVSFEGNNPNTFLYALNTVGASSMVSVNNAGVIPQGDNTNNFASTVLLFTQQ